MGRVAHCATSAVAFSWDLERYGRVDWMGGRSNKVDPVLLYFFFLQLLFLNWLAKNAAAALKFENLSSG